VIGYRKKVVFGNLRNSFPEKSETEIKSIAKGFYRNLMDVVFETIKMMTISKSDLVKRVFIENPEELKKFYLQGRSVVVLTSHQFNWEWLTASATLQIDHAVDAVYLRLTSKFSEKLMMHMRSRFGALMIEKGNFMRLLVSRRHIVKVNALMADQAPKNEANVLWTKFLHQETSFFMGAERIAKKMNLPVLYIEMWREKRGYYRARFSVLAEDPLNTAKNEITLKYIQALENAIKSKPSGWLWSHKRWKYPRKKGELITPMNLS